MDEFAITLVRAMTALKDPKAVEAVFNVAKNVKNPTIVDYVRSATATKNPKAVETVFKVINHAPRNVVKEAINLMSTGALHTLTPVVLPKEALEKFDMLKAGKKKIKT